MTLDWVNATIAGGAKHGDVHFVGNRNLSRRCCVSEASLLGPTFVGCLCYHNRQLTNCAALCSGFQYHWLLLRGRLLRQRGRTASLALSLSLSLCRLSSTPLTTTSYPNALGIHLIITALSWRGLDPSGLEWGAMSRRGRTFWPVRFCFTPTISSASCSGAELTRTCTPTTRNSTSARKSLLSPGEHQNCIEDIINWMASNRLNLHTKKLQFVTVDIRQ